jgi:hypothetical protein
MAGQGETVHLGAPKTCPDCQTAVRGPSVEHSGAGYYIGYTCNCGPYSRETGYYPSFEAADRALKTDFTADLRDGGYHPGPVTVTNVNSIEEVIDLLQGDTDG